MRILLKKRLFGQFEFGLMYGGIVLLLLLAARFLPLLELSPHCIFKSFTGLPCPTCGVTRSLVFLSNGWLLRSFAMNPLFFVCCCLFLFVFLYRLVIVAFRLPGFVVAIEENEKDWARLTAIVLVVVNWIYLLAAHS